MEQNLKNKTDSNTKKKNLLLIILSLIIFFLGIAMFGFLKIINAKGYSTAISAMTAETEEVNQMMENFLKPFPVTVAPESEQQIDQGDNDVGVPDQKDQAETDSQQKAVTMAGQVFSGEHKPEKKSNRRKGVSMGIARIFRRVDREHRPEIDADTYQKGGQPVIVALQDPV